MKEEWKPIPGYEELYEVSNIGEIRNPRRGKLLTPWSDKDGYLIVQLHKGGKRKMKRVHRLVLEAFIGPCPDGKECLHIDGDPANNKVSNLRWGTRSENILDTIKHGSHYNASKTHCPRGHELSPRNVPEHRKRLNFRQCLACCMARDRVKSHPELGDQVQQIADHYYQAIINEGA